MIFGPYHKTPRLPLPCIVTDKWELPGHSVPDGAGCGCRPPGCRAECWGDGYGRPPGLQVDPSGDGRQRRTGIDAGRTTTEGIVPEIGQAAYHKELKWHPPHTKWRDVFKPDVCTPKSFTLYPSQLRKGKMAIESQEPSPDWAFSSIMDFTT